MMLNSSHFEGNILPKLLFLSGSPQGSMTFHAADKCVLKNIAVGRRWISLNGFTIWISLPEFSHQPTDGSQIQTSRQVIHTQKTRHKESPKQILRYEPLQDEFLLGAVPLLEIHLSSIVSFMTVCSKKTYSNGKS